MKKSRKTPNTQKKRRIAWKVLLACIPMYLLLGTLLPLLHHKTADSDFMASACFADEIGPERVLCIDDNVDALLWRLRIIEAAQHEIIYSSFDFRDDNSGQDVMAALLHAADRGVYVRILLDEINSLSHSRGSAYFKALVSHPNVEIRIYNPLNLLKPWELQLCMHDKYIVADDSIYMLGGRNTNDLFLGDYGDEQNIDRELLVYQTAQAANSSLVQLRAYFESVWALDCCEPFTDTGSSSKVAEAKSALFSRYDTLTDLYPEAFTDTDWFASTIETNKITLLYNPIAAENKEPTLWYALNQLMLSGSDIIIQTPYIACSSDMYRDLSRLSAVAARVALITNAVESGANLSGCADYLNQKSKILATGVSVYEFAGVQSSHLKCILIDDRLSIVGSYNVDMRSTYLDTETMLVVDSPALNAMLRESAEASIAQSRQALPDGSYIYGEQYVPRTMSSMKRIVLTILRAFLPLMRHLL